MKLLKSLNVADCLTLLGIVSTWFGFILLIDNQPNLAIVAVGFGFVFDSLDGYIARKLKISSQFGLELDSFLDFLTYIIFAALFANLYLFDDIYVSVIGSGAIVIFGALRLVRMNVEGLIDVGDVKYYIGVISPYALVVVLLIYFMQELFNIKMQYLNLILVLVISALMIVSKKIKKSVSVLFPIVAFMFFLFCALYFEYSH